MPNMKIMTLIPLAALLLLPFGTAEAQQGSVDIKGTDSAGSYSFDAGSQAPAAAVESPAAPEGKEEGSKRKMLPRHHRPMHPQGKSEGSRPYAHKKKKCDKDKSRKEGSGRGDPHKNKDCDKAHAKKEGSGHGRSYSHHGRSGYSKVYPHGKSGHGYSKGGHGGHGRNPFAHVLGFKKKLGLTAQQVEAMKDAEFEYKKERVRAKADHKIAHMELDKLAHSGTVDEAAMRTVADRIAASKARSIHAMVEAKIALLKILTPEQRQQMTAMHSAR
jgi:Spy/CpxP family protein refolding chaperone